jgi:glycosyltransferase involved in cell wall biosynthesis
MEYYVSEDKVDITVVTSTCLRHKLLHSCCEQLKNQKTNGLTVEHIVISDCFDPLADLVASKYNAIFVSKKHEGHAKAKDIGASLASGDYICWWDDDNIYYDNALQALYSTAYPNDIGVVQCEHFRETQSFVIPSSMDHGFKVGDIDTMCICIKRKFVYDNKWDDGKDTQNSWVVRGVNDDYRFVKRLEKQGLTINFSPIIIGKHL